MKTYHARNRQDLIAIFDKHGRPVSVTSNRGSYEPYDDDTDNNIFDEAMFLLAMGADFVTLVY